MRDDNAAQPRRRPHPPHGRFVDRIYYDAHYGLLRVEYLGEFTSVPLVYASVNGEPDPAVFNTSIPPAKTVYDRHFNLCQPGGCFIVEPGVDPEHKVGEVWRSTLTVTVNGIPVLQQTIRTVDPDSRISIPGAFISLPSAEDTEQFLSCAGDSAV